MRLQKATRVKKSMEYPSQFVALTFVNGLSSSVMRRSRDEVWCILFSGREMRTGAGWLGSVSL
jgi:hypothetical protein